jgi:hypothetical protein
MAFYHPHADGGLAARAYLLTFGQLSDVVTQEARQPVGSDLALDGGVGQRWAMPSGIYETLLHVGDRDGLPMLTITSLQNLEPRPRRLPTCAPCSTASVRRSAGPPTIACTTYCVREASPRRGPPADS